MSGNVTDSIEHLLALKVMRLTRPSLEIAKNIITSESQDLVKNSFSNLNKNDSSSVESCETLASGQFLVLPQSFGNIYLGYDSNGNISMTVYYSRVLFSLKKYSQYFQH